MIKIIALLFSALKFGKVLATVGTMLLTIATYSLIYGWRFAVGFVALIFVHEMGHYLAARQRGVPVGLPVFIPFLGAWIEMKDMPHDAETEAYVAYAGPLVGSLAALCCYEYWSLYDAGTGNKLFLALAYSGFFINLFNLIPVSPLDGGRITSVVSPRLWLLGFPILLGIFLWTYSPLIILIGVIALPQLMKAINYDSKAPENAVYYATSTQTKLVYSFLYLGLVVFLAMMCYMIYGDLKVQN